MKKNIGTLVSFPQKFGITSQCQESITTVHYVNACPRSAEKWTEAAKRLNCQSISTNCTTFVYHCVMDPYKTTMIEVCAPKTLILGHFCVEYNGVGNVIQRNINARCKACPKMYKSTNVFQYPECFKIKPKVDTASDILAPLTQSNDSSNKTSSDATLYINTTANTTADLQQGIINGNKIGHGTDPTSVNTNQTTHPQSFLYQDWSGFIPHFGYGAIMVIIVFVVTMVILVRFLRRKTRNPCQLV